jgi:hypothetical protein
LNRANTKAVDEWISTVKIVVITETYNVFMYQFANFVLAKRFLKLSSVGLEGNTDVLEMLFTGFSEEPNTHSRG